MIGQATLTQNYQHILGHSETELDRLVHQARFFGELTAQVLERAGLKPGMRVLDVGCGAGDVSFLAASLVGPEGMVIGVDRSPEAIALASQRAATAGLAHVRFLCQDLSELNLADAPILPTLSAGAYPTAGTQATQATPATPEAGTAEEPVDALIGRLVLMYFADPAVLLRRLLGLVKPGGIVAFHEIDLTGAKSEPACPVFETAVERIRQTFSRAGADIQAGLKLGRIFQEAGLPAPQMIQGARVESGPDSLIYSQVEQVSRSLLPLMERTGVATAGEVGIDSLADRIREEVVAKNATLVSPCFIGAWTQKKLN